MGFREAIDKEVSVDNSRDMSRNFFKGPPTSYYL